jgi:hypothetical protein
VWRRKWDDAEKLAQCSGRRRERRPLIGAVERHLAKPKKTATSSVENAAMCVTVRACDEKGFYCFRAYLAIWDLEEILNLSLKLFRSNDIFKQLNSAVIFSI